MPPEAKSIETIEDYARRIAVRQTDDSWSDADDDALHLLAASERLVQEFITTLRHDQHVLSSQQRIARGLREGGNLKEARRLQEELVGAFTEYFGGSAHADVLAAKEDLAITLHEQGNLAITLREQGDLDKAAALQMDVLEAYYVKGGKDGHKAPETLLAMLNLAITAQRKGDLNGAFMLQRSVYRTRIAVLSDSHPDTVAAREQMEATEQELRMIDPSYGQHLGDSPLVPPWVIPSC
jgi:hypothetical protein